MSISAAMLFRDHMVLQREKKAAVWGTAEPGTKVRITIQGIMADACAGPDGTWTAILPPLQTSFEETLVIRGDGEEIVCHDVQVGEVWLAGGQSNMEYLMHFDRECERERSRLRENSSPQIRFFDYPEVSYEGELQDHDYSRFGIWRKAMPEDIDYFSAAGYYFACVINRELQVPVGIVGCNWGGTPCCCWMPEETILANGGAPWLQEYREALTAVNTDEEARKFKADPANDPSDPIHNDFARVMFPGLTPQEQQRYMDANPASSLIGTCHPWRPAGLYHTMLRKVIPYTIRGFLYYQGESDEAKSGLYRDLLKGLIAKWRKDWGEELPFLMVQLAPFESWLTASGENYPAIRQAQEQAADSLRNVWLASIGDAGMRYDIHPKNKRPVGERLALLALGHVYGKNILCDAPRYTGFEWENSRLILKLSHAEGLHSDGKQIQALQIRCGGQKMTSGYEAKTADRAIEIIFRDRPVSPVVVYYAQTPYYKINVFNAAGLPVFPFCAENIILS